MRNSSLAISLFIALFCLKISTSHAQVTIGSGLQPLQGALLDLKENNSSGGTTSTKGIIFPRVSLTNISELYPILTGTEPNYASSKPIYKGMIIYNTNILEPFEEGLYIWNGLKWELINTYPSLKVTNGLYLDSNHNVKMGGSLAEETVINQNNNQLIIDNTSGGVFKIEGVENNAIIQGASPTIEIVGKVKMTIPGELSGEIKRMVINKNGEVGTETPSTIQTLMAYAQSTTTQEYAINSTTTTSFNNGSPIVVSFADTDLVINTITSYNSTDNEFTILNPGIYEVSGYINYQPSSNGSNYAALNVIIQYQAAGTTSWDELSLSRMIFNGNAMRDLTSTIVVPAAAMQMNAGDKIRMILKKPVGDNHGNYSTPNWGIKLPTGGKFSKSIKVTAI